jgi:methionine-S-sulfoxide reductase
MNKSATVFFFFVTVIFSVPYAADSANGRATFAGGCYWCMEEAMEKVQGVISVHSGFEEDLEAVDVQYDPETITYEKLLEAFWRNIDPSDAGGQFCDRGPKYRSAIFYHDEAQKTAAMQSKKTLESRLNGPVATEIVEGNTFSVAPEEDQDFYKKQPERYNAYKTKCGRAQRLQQLWGDLTRQ